MFSEEPSTRIYGVITRKHKTRTLAVVYLKSQQQSSEDHTQLFTHGNSSGLGYGRGLGGQVFGFL